LLCQSELGREGYRSRKKKKQGRWKMSVTPEPPQALFTPGVPGASHHKLNNPTGGPMAVKVKCSDNNLYKVRPVFAVVPGGGQIGLELARGVGPAKQDKIVIQSLACPEGTTDAAVADIFKAPGAAPASATLTLVAADAPAAAPEAAPAEQITPEQLTQFDAAPAQPPA
jgi:hypothetical protein